jgi:glycyl-tRNA synthetase beta chain
VAELLLEVGCEEMPAGWLPGLGEQLRDGFRRATGALHLDPGEVTVWWTPRRLALTAEILDRQPDRDTELWGPAMALARKDGAWSKAALGFARKHGVDPDRLDQAPKDPQRPEELHLRFARREAGRPALEVVPAALLAVLRGLCFPKRMNWDAWLEDGKGSFPFGRPIRWLLAMLGGEVVPLTIFDGVGGTKGAAIVESSRRSVGHRFLPRESPGSRFEVASAEGLRNGLRERSVLLDPAERLSRIESELGRLADDKAVQHPLVAEWRDLVEYPSVLVGEVPERFQELPVEVLQTVLVHHQKYIPVMKGGRVSAFAAVADGDGQNGARIVRGMQRVVVARLRDAAFFLAEDMKRPLRDRVEDLAGVTFHESLGTYRDKAERMARLVDGMCETGLLGDVEGQAARQAALLAKADLTTLMVGEFPELQGVMGGIYLAVQGEAPAAVSSAVRWHYHPQSIDENAPPAGVLDGADERVFAAVSLADKLDTLAGYFAIGQEPTGSRDPFGLRRAAQGVIRVLLDFWKPAAEKARPSLVALTERALRGYQPRLGAVPDKAAERLLSFLRERLEFVLVSRGFPADEVAAVLGTAEARSVEDPSDCLVRLQALHRVRSEAREDFAHLAAAFKRAKNILASAPDRGVKPELFREAAERELDRAVAGLEGKDGDYETRLRSLAALRGPVDRFFEDVLVMAEEPEVRDNRLGLLARALSLFYRIADISKLGG